MHKKWLCGSCSFVMVLFFMFAGKSEAATPLSLVSPRIVTVSAGLSQTAVLQSSPHSAALGVACGMSDMCGIDPCTCGSPDQWGHCACNGTKQTPVSYKAAVRDPSVAEAAVSNGKLVIKGLSAGSTKVTVTAHLEHYTDAVQTVTVTVKPPYYLFWIIPIVAVAGALFFWLWHKQKNRTR